MKLYRCCSALLVLLGLNSPSAGANTGALAGAAATRPPPLPVGAAVRTETMAERQASVDLNFGRMPRYFVENRGQLDGRVGFYLQGQTAAYFTGDGITYSFTKPPRPAHLRRPGTATTKLAVMESTSELPEPPEASRWAVAIDLVGARRPLWPEGDDQTPTIVSYFKGPKEQWKVALPTYQTVVYRDVWPGIDLDYTVKSGQMKYTFVVQPGADPRAIKLRYRGAASVEVVDGELLVQTPLGGIRDQKPVVYQDADDCREEVAARHTLRKVGTDYVASFKLGPYDQSRPLVIDPVVLAYCGYIGGAGNESSTGIAVDAAGNAYVSGDTTTDQITFPVTVGPDLTANGGYDAFVAKVRADGTGLVYAGYIGGAGQDVGKGIAVDAAGNAYVTGGTESDQLTFPVIVGPDLTHNGNVYNPWVAKVSPDGTGLVYAGYIDLGIITVSGAIAYGIAVDAARNAYVTGGAGSDPEVSAFVAKVKADGTGLMYLLSDIGGPASNVENIAIAVDGAGNAHISGITDSDETTCPVIVGPDLTFNGGISDAFVAKVNADGTGLFYAGYIGGAGEEIGYSIAVDAAGNAYVIGYTTSDETTFPVIVGPDLQLSSGTDAYVAKVKADGTSLVYCGYIGSSCRDGSAGSSIAVDAAGNAYVTGQTRCDETTFPVTTGPDLSFNGVIDAFVAKVKADGTGLDYAGYIGGGGNDWSTWIAVDAAGNAYVTGGTYSDQTTFPVIVGPDLTFNSALTWDGFVAKVSAYPGCAATVAAVRELRAVKQRALPDNIDLSFRPDPDARGYNIWYVPKKADIDLARQASQPPAMGVTGCSAPAPAPGNFCTDFGAVSRGAPTIYFYQVRAHCDAASEGP